MKKKVCLFASFILLSFVTVGCSSNEDVISSTVTYQSEDLVYDVPSSFEATVSSPTNYYHWDDMDGERKNSCDFDVTTSSSLGGVASDYAYSNIAYMENDGNTINTFTTTINGESWAVAEVTKEKAKYSSYAIVKDGILYLLQYDDVGSGDVCGQTFDTIINSLKFN